MGPTRQFTLNVVAAVREGDRPALDEALEQVSRQTLQMMQRAKPTDVLIDFAALAGLHYARWVIIPGRGDPYQSPGGGVAPRGPDSLALNAWYDGPENESRANEREARSQFVGALVAAGRRALDALYAHCEGYPEGAEDARIVEYLLARHLPAAALYFGSPGRSCRQILDEAALARSARQIIDALRTKGPLPNARTVRLRVIAALGKTPLDFPPQERAWASLILRGLLLVVLAILFLPLTLVAPFWLLILEATDRQFDPVFSKSEREHVEQTTRGEDLFFQNPLSNVVEVKGGWFRRQLLKLVLLAIDGLAKDYFVRGVLGSIPSIHAADWYLLDGGRRLAFVSNYDSSWESYLGDFIDRAGNGLTAVWSNTSGYPLTHLLLWAGSSAGDRFKAWSHHIQVRTRVWYAAYPHLSIVEINDATLIRRGLANEYAVPPEEWLARVT
jgi:hypothetical protein